MGRRGPSRGNIFTHRAGRAREADFAEQLQSCFRHLWRISVSVVGDAALAEDVVQEAAIIALGKLDQYEPGTNFAAWMGRIVRYVSLNHARRVRRNPVLSVDPSVLELTRPKDGQLGFSAVSTQDRRGVDESIQAALAEVGDMARACLLLRTLDGLSYSEIAELLDIPEGTAMSHVHRVRSAMREKLKHLEPEHR